MLHRDSSNKPWNIVIFLEEGNLLGNKYTVHQLLHGEDLLRTLSCRVKRARSEERMKGETEGDTTTQKSELLLQLPFRDAEG